jgi:hypothetical protein
MLELKAGVAKHLVGAIKHAIKTKSTESFLEWFEWLDRFQEDTCVVRIRPDIPADPTSLMWYAYRREGGGTAVEPFYNGGLVYHESTNEWGIHS